MLTIEEMLAVMKMEQALGAPMRDGCPGVRHPSDDRLFPRPSTTAPLAAARQEESHGSPEEEEP